MLLYIKCFKLYHLCVLRPMLHYNLSHLMFSVIGTLPVQKMCWGFLKKIQIQSCVGLSVTKYCLVLLSCYYITFNNVFPFLE